MSEISAGLAALVEQRFGGQLTACRVHVGQVTMELAGEHLLEVCEVLRDDSAFGFEQLMDLCGTDNLDYGKADWQTSETATVSGFSRGVQAHPHAPGAPESGAEPGAGGSARYAVVYHLLSIEKNRRLRLKVPTEGDPPRVPSVIGIWSSADWYEREAFDLFGILFEGHPDLRRLLTDYGFVGHPFRKDFPLSGEVEVRYDPEKRRVVNEPTSIEPRTLVPRVIRHDARHLDDSAVDRDAGASDEAAEPATEAD